MTENAKATASGPAVVRSLFIRGLLELSLRGVASTAPTGAGESRRSESINYVETPRCVSKVRRHAIVIGGPELDLNN